MERAIAIFVDGIGAAAATSGVLTQLQGRIFGLLYLQTRPLALEEIAAVDTGLGAFAQGRSFAPETVQNVLRMVPARRVEKG
jgi:hypothetical protein